MYRSLALTTALVLVLSACGRQQPETQPSAPAAPQAAPAQPGEMSAHGGPMRNFPPLTIGPYQVQPMFEDELKDGHYNIRVTGGDVQAVRIWVGPEDASGVMVVRGEVEHDYYHHHVDIPSSVTEDTLLWIEIEAPDGTTHTGGTPLSPID